LIIAISTQKVELLRHRYACDRFTCEGIGEKKKPQEQKLGIGNHECSASRYTIAASNVAHKRGKSYVARYVICAVVA
jgi:hypothetical protein